eukprot:TRINITY_DN8468_c0_g1_i1.p2 TRINITY_DN8468_c0_g1~~TRINITY_DN8468_c0_g1_i1.p2  ORF type:complete len:216 (+),score=78.60 TRINITY_DN8468_c0_g1_i1:82-648(+)
MPEPLTIVLAPGNGCGDSLADCMWYPWIRDELEKRFGDKIRFVLKAFPDPLYARESIWLPFLDEQGAAGGVVIGHSSGAAAAMRYAERTQVAGIALCAAYTSDLGDEVERMSGYFSRDWDWAKMKANAGFVEQFHSANDHLVPLSEGEKVAEGLGIELHRCSAGHFQEDEFPELLEALVPRIEQLVGD